MLIELRFRCPISAQPAAYRVMLFHEIDPAARHMVTVEAGRKWIGLLGAADPVLELRNAGESLWQTLWRYFLSGVEHIAVGYDHVAFLFAVIVLGRRFWPLFAVITAFTVAHSITLSLAALAVIQLPSRLVESAIALSVLLAALNNLWPLVLGRRWIVAFAFGLVHGFGFASVLADLGLPRDALLIALVGFNLGVEAGQLAIVAVFLPTAFRLRRTWLYRKMLFVGGSALIALIAAVWLLERSLDLRLFPA